MIKINYSDNIIEVSGHANYDNKGKDIVCASVSSIIYCSVNCILSFDKNAIKYTDNSKLIIENIKKDDITNKIINNMLVLFEDLAKQYPKNIKISKGE